MNRLALLSVALFISSASFLPAQDTSPSRDALEAKFKATMTNATMTGRNIPLKDGALGEAKPDSYTIVGVEKQSGDAWIINAQFKGVVVPIPVKVQWAGDTAVIVLDHLQLPGKYAGASYNARVLIYENSYAGTWSGGDHGGFVSGQITNRP